MCSTLRSVDPEEYLDDEEESRGVDRAVAFVGGCLVLGLAILGVGGAVFMGGLFREEVPEPEQEVQTPRIAMPAQVGETPVAPPVPPPNAAPRYRPGPHVETVGVLPSGISTLRRMSSSHRGGHTLNNPWIVAGAELRPGNPPQSSGAGGPSIRLGAREDTSQALMVIPGSPAGINIVASRGQGADGDVQGLLLQFVGYNGYFFLPAIVDSELGQIRVAGVDEALLQFGIDSPTRPDGTPVPEGEEMNAMVRIASVDVNNRISAFVTRQLRVLPVGTGDVEVTVSMSEATDLDLYVVEPTGTIVYYGHTRSGTGGHLDLDANAGCSGNMGVNNEHIYWPRGRAPGGTYQVRVANYRSCIQGRQVDYRVTVRNCGETAVFSGNFVGDGAGGNCNYDPGNDRTSCQQVVSFDVTPCGASGSP